MTTDEKLVAAAGALLDAGGEAAVTMRSIGQAVGVSHNAPYKHFKDRNALLAAVAMADFEVLTIAFGEARRSSTEPRAKLRRALQVVIDYGHERPARYKLLFSDAAIAARGGELERVALAVFGEFAAIVRECQVAGHLPEMPNLTLTGLLFAAMHGLMDLEAGGRMRPEKGLAGVLDSMDHLLRLLALSV